MIGCARSHGWRQRPHSQVERIEREWADFVTGSDSIAPPATNAVITPVRIP